MLMRLLKTPANVDAICSVFCADGNLAALSGKLAAINTQTEKAPGTPSLLDRDEGKNRILLFDSTFILLSRICYVYVDMRLDELVGGGEAQMMGAFYRWTRNYQLHLNSGVASKRAVDGQARAEFAEKHLPKLLGGKAYWDESWDFGEC